MATISRYANNDKLMSKLEACRKAGLKVVGSFISGVVKVEQGATEALKCTREDVNKWRMDYNDEFWEEIDADDALAAPPPKPQQPPAKPTISTTTPQRTVNLANGTPNASNRVVKPPSGPVKINITKRR